MDQSQYVSRQVKDALKDSARYLEAECSEFVSLTHLAQRAAEDSANVLLLRIQFFEALKDRIRALSQLQARFVDSREAFRACPANLLLEGIREGKAVFACFLWFTAYR